MVDKIAISGRFFSCYPEKTRADIARLFRVSTPFVTEWATIGTLPWSRLKYLSDSQAVSWDWLLEGIGPKNSSKKPKKPHSLKPRFPKASINRRYLSLFPDMTQTELARLLKTGTSPVNAWKKSVVQVPWHRLEQATKDFNVRWDWLLDGIQPKFR